MIPYPTQFLTEHNNNLLKHNGGFYILGSSVILLNKCYTKCSRKNSRKDSDKNQATSLKQLNGVLVIKTQEKSKESEDKSNDIIKECGNILFEIRLNLFKLNG